MDQKDTVRFKPFSCPMLPCLQLCLNWCQLKKNK